MKEYKYLLKRVTDGEEFPLALGSMLIGRSDSCDIPVKSGQASREHARIRAQGEGAVVEDLHSTNGTFLNDKKIEAATPMKVGDVVRFDQESFSLQRQDHSNETIYARPISSNARGAVSIEEQDEEDMNSTVYRQSYVMPPGWSDFEEDRNVSESEADNRKQQALDNYIAKSFASLTGAALIALIFFREDDPPIIKTLSSESPEQSWTLGRGDTCDICIEQPDISELHCQLTFSDGQWSLIDQQSTNGMWLNNKKQSSLALKDGMSLYVASIELRVRIEQRT